MTTIRTAVTKTVFLGKGGVDTTLTVTAAGSIAPTKYGAAGVVGGTSPGMVSNAGTIDGAAGSQDQAMNGGDGIDLAHGGTVTNSGVVAGGTSGVYDFPSNGSTVVPSLGGVGVAGHGVTLMNTGSIMGGASSISHYDDGGGAGIDLHDSAVTNMGTIAGGASNAYSYFGGPAGDGADLKDSLLHNEGLIAGGAGSGMGNGAGGVGVAAIGGTAITNDGTIKGGNGGRYYQPQSYYKSGNGGGGVTLGTGTLINNGLIEGGNGGMGKGYHAGKSGVGVSIAGGEAINAGTITAGSSYQHVPSNNSLNAGVYINGGTLITSGLISGGALVGKTSVVGDAVQFGTLASTLEIEAGARFDGVIVGDGTNDTLVLGKLNGAGTLTGLGSTITGFTAIRESLDAQWTLSGNSTLAAGTTLTAHGTLDIAGALGGAGTLELTRNVTVIATGTLNVAAIDFGMYEIGQKTLVLDKPAEVTSTISAFHSSDTIDLVGLLANGVSFANGTLTLLENNTAVGSLALAGDYSSANFTLTADLNGGTDLNFVPPKQPEESSGYGAWHVAANPALDSLLAFIPQGHGGF